MPCEDTKILQFDPYQKSNKAPFIMYSRYQYSIQYLVCIDIGCIAEKIDGCKNNPEKSSTTKVSKHIP